MCWCIFDKELSQYTDTRIADNVKTAYANLGGTLDEGENPIAKIPITLSNMEGNMVLADLMVDDDDSGDGNDDRVANRSDPNRVVRRRVGDSNEVRFVL